MSRKRKRSVAVPIRGGFIRVRSKGDLAHEFDIPARMFQARRGLYVVVDSEPVEKSRPAFYVAAKPRKDSGVEPEKDEV